MDKVWVFFRGESNEIYTAWLGLAGWINREQQAVFEYLQEEVRVLKQIHGKRPTFNDAQRRRLAAKAKKLRYGKLKEISTIATPQTLLRWFRELVAQKYDSSKQRKVGRPKTRDEIANSSSRWRKRMNVGDIPEFETLWKTWDMKSVEIQLRTF